MSRCCYFVCDAFALLLSVFAPCVFSMDYPVEFVQNPGGTLALSGLPGYSSTPARLGTPGFGIAYAKMFGVEMQALGIAGEVCLGCEPENPNGVDRAGGRVAFSSSYLEMDSIYRRVYTEIELSLLRECFLLGVGYAFSAEWSPGLEHWGRHRYKSGGALLWKGLSFSAMCSGWTDVPWSYMEYALGLRLDANDHFGGFAEWDGRSLDVGTAVFFDFLEIRSSYRFPDFGVALSLSVCFGGVSSEGVYGTKSANWDWFGFSVSRKIRKKTIL